MHNPPRPTWIEIDRSALANNIRRMKRVIGRRCRLMAVVKANAYGHGAADVARIGQRIGVDAFAVAALTEALELRESGIVAPILVLGYTPAWLVEKAVTHNICLTLYDGDNARACDAVASHLGKPLIVHVKVNTGMNRLGIEPEEALPFMRMLGRTRGLKVEGIYTHFATADELDKTYTLQQFAAFHQVLNLLENHGLRPPVAHAANSAAALTMPDTHLQMVRSGIALYGLDPDADQTQLPTTFRPVLSWKALVAQIRRLDPGAAVSYGREYVAGKSTVVAVIPVGYADGFPRRPQTWGSVLIYGQSAPIVGRVCMDQTIVDVTDIIGDGIPILQGDEVVLIGRQEGARISAEEAGRRTGTINYDVTSRILPRVPRILT